MGVAGILFELHPPNLVRFHFFYSCKTAEIWVVILSHMRQDPLTPVSPMSKRGGVIPTTAPNVTGATRDDYEGKELQSLTL